VTPPGPVPALPGGTRLLHIGLPKTGTTTLQRGAAVNRQRLLAQGVCYPGDAFNHRDAAAALMQRPLGWRGRGAITHDRRVWDRLVSEARTSPAQRVFISSEFICESDDRQARRFCAELGDGLHIAITVRGFADLLPTNWQQAIKAGHTGGFEQWLDAVLRRGQGPTVPTFYRRNDQAAIVGRWTDLVGPDKVTVVIPDKRHPDLLITTFEQLLGLRPGTLATRPVGGYAANRGLSLAEAELVRRVNLTMREQRYDWRRYTSLIRHGLIARVQENRRPSPGEPDLRVPGWAARIALQTAREHAEAIRASGCRVIGDPAVLTVPLPTVDQVDQPNDLPLDAVVEGVAGVLSAADGLGPFFDRSADGLERRKVSDPLLDRILDADETRRVLNAHRSTQHLRIGALGVAAGAKILSQAVRRLTGRA
jgi:hypothetical protein